MWLCSLSWEDPTGLMGLKTQTNSLTLSLLPVSELSTDHSDSWECVHLPVPSPDPLHDFSRLTLDFGAGKRPPSCRDIDSLRPHPSADFRLRLCFADGVIGSMEEEESVLVMWVSLLPPQLTSIWLLWGWPRNLRAGMWGLSLHTWWLSSSMMVSRNFWKNCSCFSHRLLCS